MAVSFIVDEVTKPLPEELRFDRACERAAEHRQDPLIPILESGSCALAEGLVGASCWNGLPPCRVKLREANVRESRRGKFFAFAHFDLALP